MDYHAIHGHDTASFDPPPSSHRLRTVSAAHADDGPDANASHCLSTGLASLDKLLGDLPSDDARGGVRKGQVTEIWGPSAAGKTALGIQLVAGVLSEGRRAVWVDCLQPVCSERLSTVVTARAAAAGDQERDDDVLNLLVHYTCPSLPHFIALLCRPTATCIPQGTPLVVIDGLSGLLNHSLPRMPPQSAAKGPSKGPSPGARRLQILQYLVTSLRKLAAARGLAIVILSQCATKMQAEGGASLIPAINAGVWEQGMPTRIVLYRDFVTQQGKTTALHFAGIEKKGGRGSINGLFGDVAAFKIEMEGLVAATFDSRPAGITRPKRKLNDTDFEVTDSDGEDFGWQDDSADALPPLPSQWKGGEDVIVGTRRKESNDTEDEEGVGRNRNDEIPASDDDDDDDDIESIVPGVTDDDAQTVATELK